MNTLFQVNCPACGESVRVPIGVRQSCPSCQCEIEPDIFYVTEQLSSHHKKRLNEIANLLRISIESNVVDVWQRLVVGQLVSIPASPKLFEIPQKPEFIEPTPPTYLNFPPEPQRESFSGPAFKQAYERWAKKVKEIEVENQKRYDGNVAAVRHWNKQSAKRDQDMAEWQKRFAKVEAENLKRTNEHAADLEQWKTEQLKVQESVELVKSGYESLKPEAIKLYCKLVLQFSNLPEEFPSDFDSDYNPDTKILILDHALPAPERLSRVKEVKFVESRQELVESLLSEGDFDELYDDALYQTCLRRIYELFRADTAGALAAIVFNGWIESVDRATGNDTRACVLSVHEKKDEFQKINLARVDPKACFKALKGIGSSTLHSLTPIAPVLKINRDDKRFVASHEVVGGLDERFNLAAMDWEDFEHLIRELFEKEFSKSGSEVRVTQASRDGGVDAVVLDPDPIHGGKTIIQAKRYTNTVGVAAVRELYGTVMNEGAMKGILVTTADYGPDAYEFAKGKPIVLLNGANLLHLLEKHGHKAKIDIKEAKRILGERFL